MGCSTLMLSESLCTYSLPYEMFTGRVDGRKELGAELEAGGRRWGRSRSPQDALGERGHIQQAPREAPCGFNICCCRLAGQ